METAKPFGGQRFRLQKHQLIFLGKLLGWPNARGMRVLRKEASIEDGRFLLVLSFKLIT